MAPYADEVRLLEQVREQLVARNNALTRAIEAAVRPICLHMSPSQSGVQISGDQVAHLLTKKILTRLLQVTNESGLAEPALFEEDISQIIADCLRRDLELRLNGVKYPIHPASLSQVAFLRTLLSSNSEIVFGIGPTGTGKTHLAVSVALNHLAEHHVKQIVVTRPHVVIEGEVVTLETRRELNYDDQFEYLEDIFIDVLGIKEFQNMLDERKLVLLPLGHMRGRTFNSSFIIVDEAQNMSIRKMRMVLSRLGRGSRIVLTGDPDHVDLRSDEPSGLTHILDLLKGTDIAKVFNFDNSPIIRNPTVARIEKLYNGVKKPSFNFAA